MAHFYVTANGQAGSTASRIGSKNSGISAHARGWDVGVKIVGSVVDDQDYFHIYATGGSNNPSVDFLGTVKLVDGKPTFV